MILKCILTQFLHPPPLKIKRWAAEISNRYFPLFWFVTSQWLNPLLVERAPGAVRSGVCLLITGMMQFSPWAHAFWQVFYFHEVQGIFSKFVLAVQIAALFWGKNWESDVILHHKTQHRSCPLPRVSRECQKRRVTLSDSCIQEMVLKCV